MKYFSGAEKIRTVATLVAIVLALPLSMKALTGFYLWLSPFIMINSGFVLKSFVLLNILSLIIIVMALFRKRWFCKNLCPVGWGCDMVSRVGRRKFKGTKRIPELGKYLATASIVSALFGLPVFILLDPLAIFSAFFTGISLASRWTEIIALSFLPVILIINIVLPDIWCAKLCPLGGLQNILYDLNVYLKKKFYRRDEQPHNTNVSRRYFLASGVGMIAALSIPQVIKASDEKFLRPPGSVPSFQFNTLCIRCGNCIKSCPTDILSHHLISSDILSWMTPEVNFEDAYCLESCNLCSKVCPSGSITLFDPEAKKNIFIGTAEISLGNCLLTRNIECIKCVESCKFEAISIKIDSVAIREMPVVDNTRCVGCGACKVICPAEVISIKPL